MDLNKFMMSHATDVYSRSAILSSSPSRLVWIYTRTLPKFVKDVGPYEIYQIPHENYLELKAKLITGNIKGKGWELTCSEVQLIKPKQKHFQPAY